MLNESSVSIIVLVGLFLLFKIILRISSGVPLKRKICFNFWSREKYLRKKLDRDYQFIIKSTPLYATQTYPEPIQPLLVSQNTGSEYNYLTVFPIYIWSWIKQTTTILEIRVGFQTESDSIHYIDEKFISVNNVSQFENRRYLFGLGARKVYMGYLGSSSTPDLDDRYYTGNLLHVDSLLYYRRDHFQRIEFVLSKSDYDLVYEEEDYNTHYKTIFIVVKYQVKGKAEKEQIFKGCVFYRELKKGKTSLIL